MKLTTCLWFDGQAEDAAKFYTSVFPDSRITTVSRRPEGTPFPAGDVLTVEFELCGRPFMALNGGPQYTHSPAISFVVDCRTQAEIDRYWDLLVDGGLAVQCGWLSDRFGVSWQIVPRAVLELMTSPDPVRSRRVAEALMRMVKLDIAALREAHDGA